MLAGSPSNPTSQHIHCVQAYDGQFIRDDLNVEPPTPLKLMPLLFWYELPPYPQESACPSVRTLRKDVVGQDIVISKVWYDGNYKVVGGIVILVVVRLAKYRQELLDK
jgi:hypothetical protein